MATVKEREINQSGVSWPSFEISPGVSRFSGPGETFDGTVIDRQYPSSLLKTGSDPLETVLKHLKNKRSERVSPPFSTSR